MTFLSPWFLTALAAAGAPVILHLLNRRKRRVVPWAAMRFLMANGAQRRKSALRLKDITLLLLRMAAVAAVVLFFARPLLPAGLVPAASRDVILVLDTSLSTSQLTDSGSVWEEMSDRAGKAIESLDGGDFVRILLAAEAPQWLTPAAVAATPQGKTQLLDQLKSVQPGQGSTRLTDALAEAVNARPAREKLTRRVVVFSDFQAQSVKPDAAAAWAGVQDAARTLPSGCVVEALASGPATLPPNLAVLQVSVSREQAAAGEVLQFTAHVKNTGPAVTGVASLRWVTGDKPSGLSTLPNLKPGAVATVEFTHASPPQPGTELVTCALEAPREDVLAGDNSASVLVETVDPPGVLLVDGSGATDPERSDTAWIQAALGPVSAEEGDGPQSFRLTTVSLDHLSTETLGTNRIVILANPAALTDDTLTLLDSFVRSGGGLWLMPGDVTEAAGDSAARGFFRNGTGLSPLLWTAAEGDATDLAGALALRLPGGGSPVTRFLQDPRLTDLPALRIRRRFHFETPAPAGTEVLLALQDGTPFLAERAAGAGRVLVQAAPFNLSWSNWPRYHAFVVLLHEGLWRLAASGAVRRNLTPGESIVWPAPPWVKEMTLPVRKPDGLPGTAQRSEAVSRAFVCADTEEPGQYVIETTAGAAGASRFFVRRGDEESDLRPLTTEEQERVQSAGGLQFTDTPLARAQSVEEVGSRRPAGPLLAGAGIAFLCLESLSAALLLRRRQQALAAMEGATP